MELDVCFGSLGVRRCDVGFYFNGGYHNWPRVSVVVALRVCLSTSFEVNGILGVFLNWLASRYPRKTGL